MTNNQRGALDICGAPRQRVSATQRRRYPSTTSAEPHIGQYIALVRQHWRIFVAMIALGLAGGIGFYYTGEIRYTTRTDLVVIAVSDFAQDTQTQQAVSIDSAVQVLLSDQVLGAVARSINYPGGAEQLHGNIHISPVVNSRIIRIIVSSPTPELSYTASRAIIHEFLETRTNSLNADERVEKTEILAQLSKIEDDLQKSVPTNGAPHDAFSETREALTSQRLALEARLAALTVHEAQPGYVSREPSWPEYGSRNGLVPDLGSGFVISVVLAAAISALQQRRSPNRSRRGRRRRTAPTMETLFHPRITKTVEGPE